MLKYLQSMSRVASRVRNTREEMRPSETLPSEVGFTLSIIY